MLLLLLLLLLVQEQGAEECGRLHTLGALVHSDALDAAIAGVAAWVTAGLVQWSHEVTVPGLQRQLDLLAAVRRVTRRPEKR